MQPVRVALTGSTVSEPVNELLAVVGSRRGAGSPPRVRRVPETRAETPAPPTRDPPARLRVWASPSSPAAEAIRRPPPPLHDPTRTPVTARASDSGAAPRASGSPSRRSVRFAFVGDINLGTSTLPDGVPPDTGRGLLDAARPALVGDLVVGNFEGVLADTGTSEKCARDRAERIERAAGAPRAARAAPRHADRALARRPTRFRAPRPATPSSRRRPSRRDSWRPDSPTSISPTTTPTTSVPRAAASTERILDSLGLRLYGPLGRVAIDTVHRGDSLTTVGLIGFTTYPYAYDLLDIARSAAVVDSIRPLVDLLVVTFHGGTEGVRALHVAEAAESLGREPRGDLRRWSRAVIDAGADAVIGHGPHVLRGIEFYRGRPIVYSLGNFLTYRGFNLDGPAGRHRRAAARARTRRRVPARRGSSPWRSGRARGRRPIRRRPPSSWSPGSRREDFGGGRAHGSPPDGSIEAPP